MMPMAMRFGVLIVAVGWATPALAGPGWSLPKGFSGYRGEVVAPGMALSCDHLTVQQVSGWPEALEWAKQSGLIGGSKITGEAAYSEKIDTTVVSRRVLVVGCWVVSEVVQDEVDGRRAAYARCTYRLNDLVRSSPVVKASVSRSVVKTHVSGDYRIVYESARPARRGSLPTPKPQPCKPGPQMKCFDSLTAFEGEEGLFKLNDNGAGWRFFEEF